MQLSPDHGDIDAAIEELKRIIERRAEQHKARGELSRRLKLLRAIQIAEAQA